LCLALLTCLLPAAACAQTQATPPSQATPPAAIGPHPFIDYFRPIPVSGPLSPTAWGVATVGARDPNNGLEDPTIKQWDYWDGKIIRGSNGKYYMFASRWDQSTGHRGWGNSKAIEAVSDSRLGPYHDTGLVRPDNLGGKGHNVTALELPDHSYAIVVSETRNGDIFTSKSIAGPFTYLGPITVNQTSYNSLEHGRRCQCAAYPEPQALAWLQRQPDPSPRRSVRDHQALRTDLP
jgi:hypothetical protein